MTLLRIDPGSDVAPYEQLRTQVAAMVADGELAAGQKLPTVRQLAAALGLAANTVARAYRELEADDIISTQGRRGTFVRSRLLDSAEGRTRGTDVHAAAMMLATTARTLGLSLPETTRLVERVWSQPSREARSGPG
ncbi:MAG: GntR family transcriptional regulator [Actinomycetota bacterium]|nr:GntR family transcriptional regulator [Actinomycetota bacterium]